MKVRTATKRYQRPVKRSAKLTGILLEDEVHNKGTDRRCKLHYAQSMAVGASLSIFGKKELAQSLDNPDLLSDPLRTHPMRSSVREY